MFNYNYVFNFESIKQAFKLDNLEDESEKKTIRRQLLAIWSDDPLS